MRAGYCFWFITITIDGVKSTAALGIDLLLLLKCFIRNGVIPDGLGSARKTRPSEAWSFPKFH